MEFQRVFQNKAGDFKAKKSSDNTENASKGDILSERKVLGDHSVHQVT